MTTISLDPITAAPAYTQRGNRYNPGADRGRGATAAHARLSYAGLIGADVDPARHGLARLDAPCPTIATAPHDDTARTFDLRVESTVVGVASVSRELSPGPPLRGVYRIHGVAARVTGHGQGDGTGVIERCIAHAAATGGRLLWCHAALDAVDTWRRHGFSVVGPPVTTGDGVVGVFMVRRLTPADAAS